ncbi:hypothetical protein PQE12_gp05 [Arthrobacter phage Adumb2043]|uniref:Uncharacterized protein n=1 Tax=Arthrobacter phage Adumb2043 TaxID=2776851 RepID=A0A7M1CKS9_9CAUD|nr:hypothetical protein PQE12_gp05 [Arthrobacter phage Adumb2043]QOP65065.1 hypothetical protein SEA_ADUMB2043_5 [Arthrobacter phage Adumb2043]
MLHDRAPEPFELTYAPARYPAPDWEAIGRVTKIWVPDDETVGWLVFQDPDRLAFLSDVGPDKLGYTIRELVRERMAYGAKNGIPAPDLWTEILTRTLHTTPTEDFLPAILADVRSDWNG